MRLLLLGGTLFEAALRRGHRLTLFNRGLTDPDAFAGLEQVRGDRERDLSLLGDRSWDAVIDTSGYVPRVVGSSARLLARAVEHYTFVSTIAVYEEFRQLALGETARVARLPEPGSEDVARYYGELKAACEAEVRAALAGRALIVRPGLIVGPEDPTERSRTGCAGSPRAAACWLRARTSSRCS